MTGSDATLNNVTFADDAATGGAGGFGKNGSGGQDLGAATPDGPDDRRDGAGSGGGNGGNGLIIGSGGGGGAFGSGLLLQGNEAITLAAAFGQTLVAQGAIADQDAVYFKLPGGTMPPTGSSANGTPNAGLGTLVVDGPGVVLLAADLSEFGGPINVLIGATLQVRGQVAHTLTLDDSSVLDDLGIAYNAADSAFAVSGAARGIAYGFSADK